VRKAVFNSEERKRLYKEAKQFLTLRAARNRAVKEARRIQGTLTTAASEASSSGND
jgi:hypothetical protein